MRVDPPWRSPWRKKGRNSWIHNQNEMRMTKANCIPYLLVIATFFAAPTLGFFSSAPAKKFSSPLMDEAVQIYDNKFPFGRDPPKSIGLGDFGMPNRDIDGTVVKKTTSKKRLTDISEQQAKESFAELAKVYGEERALDMVKTFPLCLAFDKSAFGPSLSEWANLFGEEESKEMVRRNPGLLAVKPAEAAKGNDQTMVFSYIVAATRPFGSFLLSGLAALLSVPVIEGVTGVDIHNTFAELLKFS